MLKMHLLKYSSFMRARPRRPRLRSRAQDPARISNKGVLCKFNKGARLISNIGKFRSTFQTETRERFYTRKFAHEPLKRRENLNSCQGLRELFKLLLLFQATFQCVSYCCREVSSTRKCRLRSSLDRRKLFVNRCSFVTPVPWYIRTRRLRLIPLCILFFATGN